MSLLAGAPEPAHAIIRCGAPSASCQSVANPDNYSIRFTSPPATRTIKIADGLLANDVAPTGVNIAVDTACSCSTTSFGGAVTLFADGHFLYTPPASFTGEDSFTYSITDAPHHNVSSAIVRIVVTPVIAADTYQTPYNSTLTVKAPGVFGNDTRPSFSLIESNTAASHGALTLGADGGFTYTPDLNFHGADSFTYTVFDLNFDAKYTATVSLTVSSSTTTTTTKPGTKPPPPPKPNGYWMVGRTGTVYSFGQLRQYGNAHTTNVTHIEPTPSRKGYWILDGAGHVYPFGDAIGLRGASQLAAGETASSLSTTPTGKGFWIFTNRGRVFTRGDAKFFGDMSGTKLNGPIVGSIPTPSGKGYYMVASDGGIFAFGNARFFGSMGGARLNKPVNGIVPTADSRGYWLVASDGGIFAFGRAGFRGSMGGAHLNNPVIGIVRYGNGYLMVSSDGGIFAFSNLPFLGSLGSHPPAVPIVGVASGG